jgi:Transposase DDE domain
LGERSGAPSGLRPSSFVMCNTPVEVQFTSAGCLNYPCRTPLCAQGTAGGLDHQQTVWHVNPTRKFVIGGPDGDCGPADQLVELGAFLRAQPHYVLLDGNLFPDRDARAFQLCFVTWVAALTNTPAEVIAIDGKTSRRSYQNKGSKEAIHIVSAFAARQRIVLGQVKVNEKSNEIIAIPALLDMMSIEGAVVTVDAMGCQRNVAAKIIEKKADYILALKGNQEPCPAIGGAPAAKPTPWITV